MTQQRGSSLERVDGDSMITLFGGEKKTRKVTIVLSKRYKRYLAKAL